MDWTERLNSAINYIEEHLLEELDYEQLGRIAACSAYHFQRMFAYLAGIPLSEYVRRRKMSLAAVDIKADEAKIIDIALKYGYDSPTAFNRAFQSVHGIAPSVVRNENASIKSFSPITFKAIIKGVDAMNYRIEKKEAFRIVGVSEPLHTDVEMNFETVPKMWQSNVMNGNIPKIAAMMNTSIKGLLGVSACYGNNSWKYFIAAASTLDKGDFDEYIVPACTWAIFPGVGTSSDIQELERRIVTEWLPTSGYEYANAPDVEVYINPEPSNAQYEVWIPVVRK